MERDKSGIKIDGAHIISTHALTWSATYTRFQSGFFKLISTHALTWSATLAVPIVSR